MYVPGPVVAASPNGRSETAPRKTEKTRLRESPCRKENELARPRGIKSEGGVGKLPIRRASVGVVVPLRPPKSITVTNAVPFSGPHTNDGQISPSRAADTLAKKAGHHG